MPDAIIMGVKKSGTMTLGKNRGFYPLLKRFSLFYIIFFDPQLFLNPIIRGLWNMDIDKWTLKCPYKDPF